MSTAWKESLTLAETNAVRVSLGLKPIADPALAPTDAPVELTSDEQGEVNYSKRLAEQRAEKEAKELQAKIDKLRNTRERNRKLVGVGLGADPNAAVKQEEGTAAGEGDTKAWIKMQKRQAKLQAQKREKEQAERDLRDQEEEKGRADLYGEKDLLGLKVGHDAEDFEEGEDVVLTLKDSRILDDDDDELHNLNITENSATAAAVELKKKGRTAGQYTGFEEEDLGADGAKASVLKKYDEEIEGKEEPGFRLGGPIKATKAGKGKEVEAEGRERVVLSMDYRKDFVEDYLVEGEVGFKKPKIKKKRPTKTATLTMEDDDVVATPIVPVQRQNLDETNLIDDDDLQAYLSRARREMTKKRLDAAKERRANGMDLEPEVKEEEEDDEKDVIVMDDTSEFVRNIANIQARPVAAPQAVAPKAEAKEEELVQVKTEEGEEGDEPMTELEAGGWGEAREDGELDPDNAMDDDTNASALDEMKPLANPDDDDDFLPSSTSTLVSKGMFSTLTLLRHQGLLVTRTPEEIAADNLRKTREAWLATQRRRDIEREEEKIRNREAGDSKTQQQREIENRRRERDEARETMEAFNDYKPVVDIKYHDEFGRNQTPKEAWKQLSHNFHGKGSGSGKMEKRLKKIEEERKREMMNSGDTPLGTVSSFQRRAELVGSATMVLSVGNKGSAPVSAPALAVPKKLAKALPFPSASARKTKAAPADALFGDIPMRSLPLPASGSSSSGNAGFRPIGSSSDVGADGSAASKERIQIVPVSVKRKPAAAPTGEPSGKK